MKKHVLALSLSTAFKQPAAMPVPRDIPALPAVDPTRDHKRVSPQGKAIGAMLVRLVEPAIQSLSKVGEPDERCKSCAFRAGTVPNGCLQTQLDACKAILEQNPFRCHVEKLADGTPQICHGWFAMRWARGDIPADFGMDWWEYSPPDAEEE